MNTTNRIVAFAHWIVLHPTEPELLYVARMYNKIPKILYDVIIPPCPNISGDLAKRYKWNMEE